ncbi:MAG: RNA 3'-terminal phosphate cyclase, partial [Acidobacteriota bacterium]|nr:RNA 3'-terminal phosphate cyclase [Acidobacteriota bacterium]
LERYGFYPPGGGKFNVTIEPAAALNRLDLIERGEMRNERARALVVKLPPMIAERELAVVGERMKWGAERLYVETSTNALSPGNVVMIEFESEHLTEMFSRVGERGVRAEVIAEDVVKEAQQYLATNAPVGEHLADQLLIPLALARGGSFTTGQLSLHTTTNIEIIKKFLDVDIIVEPLGDGVWKVEVTT